MGMYTYINEGAVNISGGQKQRILIPRDLATKPGFLFFDEAMSDLDNASQKIVRESLKRLHLIRIIIAHQLSSIEAADVIFLLDQGNIVKQGLFS